MFKNHRKFLTVLILTGCAVVIAGKSTTAVSTPKSTATLPPKKVMDVLEFEIGAEIGSKGFETTYKKDIKLAKDSAKLLVKNLDKRYLHAAGIKHRLGKVIVRTDSEKDPLRNSVTKGNTSSLKAFKNYWNTNSSEVGSTHDLAVYHVCWAPSGMAYVNSVGSGNRYAMSCGYGSTSWADGTIAHEFGHSWNLHHNNKSGFFYEARPRNDKGSNSRGGNNYHISIMHGGVNHNIGRLATEEANKVYQTREAKRSKGDLVKDPGPIRPFGSYDQAITKDRKPVKIDVIDNDYDCNNDVLDVALLDTVSSAGGTIALSKSTGPGGRNELVYTPPANFVGKDFFHYTVFDKTGLKDWGAVYVRCDGPRVVNTSKKKYNYDFGPLKSPVENNWDFITPETEGDIYWSFNRRNPLKAVDRGEIKGVNKINCDFVSSSGRATLNHKIANGTWNIVLNMGDSSTDHDKMRVRAEGQEIGDDITALHGNFPYVEGSVVVLDGELNLEFSDAGGKNPDWAVTRLSLKRI